MNAVMALHALALGGCAARNGRLRHASAFGAGMTDRARGIETKCVIRSLAVLRSDQPARMGSIDQPTGRRAVEYGRNAEAVLTGTLHPAGCSWPIAGHHRSFVAHNRGEACNFQAAGNAAQKVQEDRDRIPIAVRAARRSLDVHDASVERGDNVSIIFSPSQASAREAAI